MRGVHNAGTRGGKQHCPVTVARRRRPPAEVRKARALGASPRGTCAAEPSLAARAPARSTSRATASAAVSERRMVELAVRGTALLGQCRAAVRRMRGRRSRVRKVRVRASSASSARSSSSACAMTCGVGSGDGRVWSTVSETVALTATDLCCAALCFVALCDVLRRVFSGWYLRGACVPRRCEVGCEQLRGIRPQKSTQGPRRALSEKVFSPSASEASAENNKCYRVVCAGTGLTRRRATALCLPRCVGRSRGRAHLWLEACARNPRTAREEAPASGQTPRPASSTGRRARRGRPQRARARSAGATKAERGAAASAMGATMRAPGSFAGHARLPPRVAPQRRSAHRPWYPRAAACSCRPRVARNARATPAATAPTAPVLAVSNREIGPVRQRPGHSLAP